MGGSIALCRALAPLSVARIQGAFLRSPNLGVLKISGTAHPRRSTPKIEQVWRLSRSNNNPVMMGRTWSPATRQLGHNKRGLDENRYRPVRHAGSGVMVRLSATPRIWQEFFRPCLPPHKELPIPHFLGSFGSGNLLEISQLLLQFDIWNHHTPL